MNSVAAGGDVVAFLDDDAVAAPDWLEQLLSYPIVLARAGRGGLIEPGWTGAARSGSRPSLAGWWAAPSPAGSTGQARCAA